MSDKIVPIVYMPVSVGKKQVHFSVAFSVKNILRLCLLYIKCISHLVTFDVRVSMTEVYIQWPVLLFIRG